MRYDSKSARSCRAPHSGPPAGSIGLTVLIAGLSAVCVGVCCQTSVIGQENRPLAPRTTTMDATDNFHEIILPAQNGIIQWNDVAAALSRPLSLDTAVARRLFPAKTLDLNGKGVLLTLLAVDVAMGDSASISMTHTAEDRLALKLRVRVPPRERAEAVVESTLDLDEDWQPKTVTRPLVICVHGIGSSPEIFAGLRGHLRGQGYATAAVSYDDSASIAQSAAEIAKQVRQQFRIHGPPPRLALVGHSAGGLVAREWTENPQLAGDNVAALITIGTPHFGSSWASMPPLLDLVNKSKLSSRELVDVLLHTTSSAGLRDLEPGSERLRAMNSRPRRVDVAYTSIIGTASPVKAAEVAVLRKMIRQLDQEGSFVRLIRPRIRPLLDNFAELSSGTGDGVVTVTSAAMPGVDDKVEIPLSHSEIVHLNPADSTNPTWVTITDRLNRISRITTIAE